MLSTLTVCTAAGSNATAVGEAYAAFEGVLKWRDPVDSCDDDGQGRVFFEFEDSDEGADAMKAVCQAMDNDNRVIWYD